MNQSSITLVGLMGSGKSTLGKLIASRAFLPFVDLDELIVKQAGKKIPQIFHDEGEDSFRALESECLAHCLESDQQVLATGGGAVLSPTNRTLMRDKSRVIWLDANPEILAARISGDGNRPLLNGVDPLSKVLELTAQRNALYREIADLKIDTGSLSDQEAVAKIIDFLSDCDA